jgi:4-amino-4-deoxy-L-arabinose transferase-like glycosyltransferase
MVLMWLVLSIGWTAADRIVRDGDEEGHVGAAELYLQDLSAGDFAGYATRAWTGRGMGEYPQAYAAAVGGWWWLMGGGNPGRTPVRAFSLLMLLGAAVMTGKIARRFAAPGREGVADLIAVGTVLLLPLCNGLARHFMPEGLLVFATAASVWAALRLAERPSPGRALVLGAAIGWGLLSKQTFVLVGAIPLLYLVANPLRRHPRSVLFIALGLAAVAGPWVATHLGAQVGYLTDSAVGHGNASVWAHIAYYPWSAAWLGLGPPLTLAAGAAAIHCWRRPDRRAFMLGLAWLIGGMVLLALLPKKYPRLIAPLLPAVAIWIAVAVTHLERPSRWLAGGSALSIGWLVWASVSALPLSWAPPGVDPGCPQQWLRPPIADDLGLSAVEHAVASQQLQTIGVIDPPEIPCTVQTTPGWMSHLGPHLRRAGHEVRIVSGASPAADLIIDWRGGPGQPVEVPSLGTRVYLRDVVR